MRTAVLQNRNPLSFLSVKRKRKIAIAFNTFWGLSSALFSFLISLIFVRKFSVEHWGEVLTILLPASFLFHVITWGNKEYLLKSFSTNPRKIATEWSYSTSSRLILLLAGCIIIAFVIPQCIVPAAFWLVARCISQSSEALIIYEKKFTTALLCEIAGAALIAGFIFFSSDMSASEYLILLSFAEILKAIILFSSFRKIIQTGLLFENFSFSYLGKSVFFFLPGFTGMLQSRIDQLLILHLLSKESVGKYSILMNFLLLLQGFSAYLLSPFVKNIYRLKEEQINKISWQLLKYGIILCFTGITFVFFLMKYAYHINLDIVTTILAGCFVLPVFWYSPQVYKLYKSYNQQQVVVISLAATALNVLFTIYLTRRMAMNGALTAGCISQLFLAAAYRRTSVKSYSANYELQSE